MTQLVGKLHCDKGVARVEEIPVAVLRNLVRDVNCALLLAKQSPAHRRCMFVHLVGRKKWCVKCWNLALF